MLKLQWQFEYRIIQYTKIQEDGMLKKYIPSKKNQDYPYFCDYKYILPSNKDMTSPPNPIEPHSSLT